MALEPHPPVQPPEPLFVTETPSTLIVQRKYGIKKGRATKRGQVQGGRSKGSNPLRGADTAGRNLKIDSLFTRPIDLDHRARADLGVVGIPGADDVARIA